MTNVPRLLLPPLACAVVWLGLAVSPQAIERKPLPAFEVTAPGGATVRSADLTQPGKWLFLYVQPSCKPCETLLRAIDEAEQPLVASRMVIVVGGLDEAGVARFAATFPQLTTAVWYADTTRTVLRLVKAPTVPFVFGMKRQTTEWGWVGVVPDAASAASALVGWAGIR